MTRNGPIQFIQKLLVYGMNPNEKNSVQRTPLHYAMQQQTSIDLVDLLLTVGADPNALDKLGMTPIHWGVLENVPSAMIQLAVVAGGDLNQVDNVRSQKLMFLHGSTYAFIYVAGWEEYCAFCSGK